MNKNLYVDVHIIQDVPPANLNRDDAGSPKSARYGGVDRLRVSSQAWKRATRKAFADSLDTEQLGMRTRRVTASVINALSASGVPEGSSEGIANELLKELGITPSKKSGRENEASYLLFFSKPQLRAIAAAVNELPDLWDSPVELAKRIDVAGILSKGHSLDVALFGRMVADLPEINVDAACQVAHALGTHAAATQFDYFTAVDDAQESDESGAGMIGTIEFNSATVYRYATVNVPALIENMSDKDAALAGVQQFLRSFVLSMPSGKQNTFAAHTRPTLVWVVVRGDQPVNYMSAFEKPVSATDEGYAAKSARELAEFAAAEASRWGDSPQLSAASYDAKLEGLAGLDQNHTFDELVDLVGAHLERAVTDE